MAVRGGVGSEDLVRYLTYQIRALMAREADEGRSAPFPREFRWEWRASHDEYILYIVFHNCEPIGVRFPRGLLREMSRDSGNALPTSRDLIALWSRCYEDHQVEREIAVHRRQFLEIVQNASCPHVIAAAEESYLLRCEEVQRHRAARFTEYYEPRQRPIQGPHDRRTEINWRDRHQQVHLEPIPPPTYPRQYVNEVERMAARIDAQMWNALFYGDTSASVGTSEAQQRGMDLLKAWLSPLQLRTYEKERYFDVIGCHTAKTYRIRHGRSLNIDELGPRERKVCTWCFLPQGGLVEGDVMLAQKIALENNECEALAIANRFAA